MLIVHIARKPLSENSVSANVLKHGTGALNINDSRITTTDNLNGGTYSGGKKAPHFAADERSSVAAGRYGEDGRLSPEDFKHPGGRWPSNLILQHKSGGSDCPVAELGSLPIEGEASRFFKQVQGSGF